jgi:hypothetical protein
MIQTSIEPSLPLSIIILCYIATGALVLILLLLFIMNSRLSALSAKLSRSSRPTKPETYEAYEASQTKIESPNVAEKHDTGEAPAGTHFEEFLNEDRERRKLTKKEKFKAYREWRTEKGLNWSK